MALPFPRCCPWPPTGLRYHHLGTAQVCSGLLRGKGRDRCFQTYSTWKSLSHVRLFVTPWTIQSMAFSRPEYWSGETFPSPEDLPNLGIEPRSPTLQADSLPAEPQEKPGAGPRQLQSLGRGCACAEGVSAPWSSPRCRRLGPSSCRYPVGDAGLGSLEFNSHPYRSLRFRASGLGIFNLQSAYKIPVSQDSRCVWSFTYIEAASNNSPRVSQRTEALTKEDLQLLFQGCVGTGRAFQRHLGLGQC